MAFQLAPNYIIIIVIFKIIIILSDVGYKPLARKHFIFK